MTARREENMSKSELEKRIRALLIFFMAGLCISGLSAVPLEWETGLAVAWIGPGTWMASVWPAMAEWMALVHEGVIATARLYPFILYGTDWLAFAHLVIAVAFIGPLRDPVKNIWVIEFGMLACLLTFPWILMFVGIRHVPSFWILVDMVFGTIGILPLWLARKYTLQLART
jgi:hypothetical protein